MRPSLELSREECRALLASRTVGRIAFQTGNGLRVLPVNYVVLEDRIVFRTAEHGVIARSIRAAEVAFQVDDLDGQTATGWSVLVQGRTGPWSGEVPVISPWAPGRREVAVAIEPTSWSGRSVSADEGV